MNAARLITTLGVLTPLLAFGQSVASDMDGDPVLKAIREFNERQEETTTPNEVKVVLDPPALETSPPESVKTEPPKTAEPIVEPAKPVLVTGKPPQNAELLTPSATPEPPVADDNSLSVDVEKLQSGKGVVQSGTIKLLAPFPPKNLSNIPAGWQLEPQADVPVIHKDIELSPGQKITLTIRPHLLTPLVDGSSSFAIREPGYNPALGYQQTATVGAILSNSVRQLDEDAKLLGNVIDNLQQLLVSLPTPEPPAPVPAPAPSSPPATNRSR